MTLEPGFGAVSANRVKVSPFVTMTYTLTVSNSAGSHSAEVEVRVPPPAPPERPTHPNSLLFGRCAFATKLASGETVTGEFVTDRDLEYEGSSGAWGFVSSCSGEAALCERAPVGALLRSPGGYLFGLGAMDMSVVFVGTDEDGQIAQISGRPVLTGAGLVDDAAPATFRVEGLE